MLSLEFTEKFQVTIYISAKMPVSEDDITIYRLDDPCTFVIKKEGISSVINVIWTVDQLIEDVSNADLSQLGTLTWVSSNSSASTEYDSGDSNDCEYIFDKEAISKSEAISDILEEEGYDIDEFMQYALDDHSEEFEADDLTSDHHQDYLDWFKKVVGEEFHGMKASQVCTLYTGEFSDAQLFGGFVVEEEGEETSLETLVEVFKLLATKGYECNVPLSGLAA
jgi:hypothetical protein